MAGTTGLEPAASALTALGELVLQQLRTTRGLANLAQVVQDTMNCGLEICLSMQPRRSVLSPNLDFFSSGWIHSGLWTIFIVLLILWLRGFSLHVGGGLIHLLLVVGLVVLVINLLGGRRSAS